MIMALRETLLSKLPVFIANYLISLQPLVEISVFPDHPFRFYFTLAYLA